MQNTTLGPELQVSMGPGAHLWFFAFKTATFGSELQVSLGPRSHLSFCLCKTACLDPE